MQTPEEILKELKMEIKACDQNIDDKYEVDFYLGKRAGLDTAYEVYQPLMNEFDNLCSSNQLLLDEVNRLNAHIEGLEKYYDNLRHD